MHFIIKYRFAKSYDDQIVTCSGEQQTLLLAQKIKAMGVEYLHIYRMKYDLELTQRV